MAQKDSQENKVVVSAPSKGSGLFSHLTRLRQPHLSKRIRTVVVLILIGACVLTAWFWIAYDKNHQLKQETPHEVYMQANQLELSGQYSDAESILNKKLNKTTSKIDQGQIYEYKAEVALSSEKYEDALSFAKKGEALNPTKNSAQLIAETALVLNNKQLALKYYKILLSRIDTKTDDYTAQGVKNIIQSLEKQ